MVVPLGPRRLQLCECSVRARVSVYAQRQDGVRVNPAPVVVEIRPWNRNSQLVYGELDSRHQGVRQINAHVTRPRHQGVYLGVMARAHVRPAFRRQDTQSRVDRIGKAVGEQVDKARKRRRRT
jgi:hypothetical protein